MRIFDTHSHYNDSKYDEDRYDVLKDIYANFVDRIVLVGANLKDSISEKTLALEINAKTDMPKCYFTVGTHPDEIPLYSPESTDGLNYLAALEECSKVDGKVKAVAIGEIGLDYYGDSKTDETYKKQFEWFIAEMELAKKLNLPVVIHSRDACNDTYKLIKEYGKGLTGIIHCFGYEKEIAKKYIDLGFYIGVGGVLTFKNARKLVETVEAIPVETIVTETDCPYLAPTPHRGERNVSSYIHLVIDEIAKIKKISKEELANTLYDNAIDVFNLKNEY